MGGPSLYRRLAAVTVVFVALALLVPAASSASVVQEIIERCGHGESLSGFSQSDYAKALRQLSATTEEYSECGQLIRQAQLDAALDHGRGARSSAPAAALSATPAETRSLAQAARSAGAEPVSIGGQLIHPGVVHANIASAFSTLPTPVLALLGFLAACVLATGGAIVRKRIRDGHGD
jgi:hypothetical protein